MNSLFSKIKTKIKPYFGNKEFYKMTFAIIIPVVIQQVIVSISGYVDNLMIDSFSKNILGSTVAYDGVSTANRFILIMISLWIGSCAGISVFLSQYHGAEDRKGLVGIMQLSIFIIFIIGVISTILISYVGPEVLSLFIKKDKPAFKYGYDYLKTMSYGVILLFANMMVSNIYRSIKKTNIPLISGIIGVFVNIFFNYILINGKLGCPQLGATGAAIGTLISNGLQLFILIYHALFLSKDKYIYDVFKSLNTTKDNVKEYLKKGFPISVNEILWAISMQLIALFVTMPGNTGNTNPWLSIFNYTNNITDLFYVYFSGLATGVAVLVGGRLGAGEFEKAKDYAKKMTGIAVMAASGAVILLALFTPALLFLFNFTPKDPEYLMIYYATLLSTTGLVPYAISVVLYYIIRSGGDTLRAFLVDQVPTWLVTLPTAFLLGYFEKKLQLGFLLIFFLVRATDFIKMTFSIIVYRKETWVKNITLKQNNNSNNINN